MKKRSLLLTILMFVLGLASVAAQKILLLENARKVRPQKFYIGQELTYKLDERQATWLTDEILDILPQEKSLLLGIQKVPLADIQALRFRRPMLDGLGKQIGWMGIQTTFYASLGLLFYDSSDQFAKKAVVVGAATAVSSVLLFKFLKHKNVLMGKKFRLRAIEIPI